jgi:hypothetical protein
MSNPLNPNHNVRQGSERFGHRCSRGGDDIRSQVTALALLTATRGNLNATIGISILGNQTEPNGLEGVTTGLKSDCFQTNGFCGGQVAKGKNYDEFEGAPRAAQQRFNRRGNLFSPHHRSGAGDKLLADRHDDNLRGWHYHGTDGND